MELISADVEAKTKYTAHDTFTVTANKKLEIKGDDMVLKTDVPSGKQWVVDMHISIIETDA